MPSRSNHRGLPCTIRQVSGSASHRRRQGGKQVAPRQVVARSKGAVLGVALAAVVSGGPLLPTEAEAFCLFRQGSTCHSAMVRSSLGFLRPFVLTARFERASWLA
jgi:hypothetical protein